MSWRCSLQWRWHIVGTIIFSVLHSTYELLHTSTESSTSWNFSLSWKKKIKICLQIHTSTHMKLSFAHRPVVECLKYLSYFFWWDCGWLLCGYKRGMIFLLVHIWSDSNLVQRCVRRPLQCLSFSPSMIHWLLLFFFLFKTEAGWVWGLLRLLLSAGQNLEMSSSRCCSPPSSCSRTPAMGCVPLWTIKTGIWA